MLNRDDRTNLRFLCRPEIRCTHSHCFRSLVHHLLPACLSVCVSVCLFLSVCLPVCLIRLQTHEWHLSGQDSVFSGGCTSIILSGRLQSNLSTSKHLSSSHHAVSNIVKVNHILFATAFSDPSILKAAPLTSSMVISSEAFAYLHIPLEQAVLLRFINSSHRVTLRHHHSIRIFVTPALSRQ